MATTKISARATDPGPSSRALPHPVLEAGNTGFPNGDYTLVCEDREPGQSFTLRHQVTGAPLIERWLDAGKVEYVCTVAAPRSMYREMHKSDTPEQLVAWQRDELGEFPMFTPMIVARVDIQHTAVAKADGLNVIWNGRKLILRKGSRIAVGPTFKFKSGIAGILDFIPDEELPPGQLWVEESTQDGFKFKVHLAANLFQHLKYRRDDPVGRNIMVHIVSAALGILQREWSEDDNEEGWRSFRNLSGLSDLLQQNSIHHWSEEEFQPEYAATILYPHILPVEGI